MFQFIIIIQVQLICPKISEHIEIKHYFIGDHVIKKDVELNFVYIENQLVSIFTKPLVQDRFDFFKEKLNITNNKNFC